MESKKQIRLSLKNLVKKCRKFGEACLLALSLSSYLSQLNRCICCAPWLPRSATLSSSRGCCRQSCPRHSAESSPRPSCARESAGWRTRSRTGCGSSSQCPGYASGARAKWAGRANSRAGAAAPTSRRPGAAGHPKTNKRVIKCVELSDNLTF